MHRTLKQETTRPASLNFLQQQERFDLFINDFNNERPHEGLGMNTPSAKYKTSNKKYPAFVPEPEYPGHDHTCYVGKSGKVYVPKHGNFNLSGVLAGEYIGLKEEDDKLWTVDFMNLPLGYYDGREEVFHVANSDEMIVQEILQKVCTHQVF
jgi:hypothetical protein